MKSKTNLSSKPNTTTKGLEAVAELVDDTLSNHDTENAMSSYHTVGTWSTDDLHLLGVNTED
jgi:hypothetical protein